MATACIVVIALEVRLDSQPLQSLLGGTTSLHVAIMASSAAKSSFNVDVDVESTIAGPGRRVVVAAADKSVVKAGVMPVDAAVGIIIDSHLRRSSVRTTTV